MLGVSCNGRRQGEEIYLKLIGYSTVNPPLLRFRNIPLVQLFMQRSEGGVDYRYGDGVYNNKIWTLNKRADAETYARNAG